MHRAHWGGSVLRVGAVGVLAATFVMAPRLTASASSAHASPPYTVGVSNNLVGTGDYGFHQVLPGGGLPGCGAANGSGALGALNGCMGSTWTFSNNALVGSSAPVPGSPYPTKPNCGAGTDCTQFTASSWNSVGFVNFNNGNAGEYHLLSTSPYKNAAADGRDLGADIDGLLAATQSVE